MMGTIRLTMAQALVRYLAALRVDHARGERLFAGMWAIFGHGNVAGVGEALHAVRDELPTLRAHNEQAMAHAAIAFAKASMRRRMMACTTSIGPGATNLVTAAALAHVNRLPVLLLPGDIFVTREPDPVLQQVEDFHDGTVSANDCLRPVSRYFDRIVHPAQLLTALPRALHALTDPATCGPVTLALPQDVQTMAWDYPEAFLAPEPVRFGAPVPEAEALESFAKLVGASRRPLIIAGGGVLYSEAATVLTDFAGRHGIPVAETQAGKGAIPWDHKLAVGSIGVTGSTAANALAREADLVIAVGTRLQDFTTGSHALFAPSVLASINVNPIDATKWRGRALVADALVALVALERSLGSWRSDAPWIERAETEAVRWRGIVDDVTGMPKQPVASDAEVIGAVQRSTGRSADDDIVVCAAGSLPGELHKLWRTRVPGGYHVEYGYSCMGYEIAGAVGVKLARPDREVVVMVGDGSYLMMNSEIATSVMLGAKLTIVVLDNGGFGCIHRLQEAVGGPEFNNLLDTTGRNGGVAPAIDFAAHAASLGAVAENVASFADLDAALKRARESARTAVVCVRTDPDRSTGEGGVWWDVAVPEMSARNEVQSARSRYEAAKREQRP